jgi:hypothetical protein|tara:strand:- start:30 stop:236 length:207 start_codon:yes stop_codon:yes gene_type:complete
MEVGSVIKDKKSGNLGVIFEVCHMNVIGIEELPVYRVLWRGESLEENVVGNQLLNERYEFVRQIKDDI